jgi:hypothetical protein
VVNVFIEVLDELRLFFDQKLIFSEKIFSVGLQIFIDHIDKNYSTDLVSLLDLSFLCLEGVQVKNLGSTLKPSRGSHKKKFGLFKDFFTFFSHFDGFI